MRKVAVGLFVGLVAGAMLGFALGIFIYPFWFLRDTAMEQLGASSDRIELARGAFIHVNPSDPIHWGTGLVSLHREQDGQAVAFLHDDFEVGPGPRFHVYLVTAPQVQSRDDFLASEKLDLGRLRAFKGSQIYSVPPDADLARYRSVVIWCKEFGVLISPASLDKAAMADRSGTPTPRNLARIP